jgi:hypothetical protein
MYVNLHFKCRRAGNSNISCLGGGISPTKNRTEWPISGGAVAFQPGWLPGHSTAFVFINLGLGADPPHYSIPMKTMFELRGPTNDPYPNDSFCLPQIPPPTELMLKEGDFATIQIVQVTKHGATLFSVRLLRIWQVKICVATSARK